jgi:hypothetical protein
VILFQDRFAGKVRDGSKCQTIRRAARCKPGDTLSLRRWTGKPYRSKQETLRETVCTAVFPVEIRDELGIEWIRVNRVYVNRARFARADGFACSTDMLAWFDGEHGLPFAGEVIMWSNAPAHLPPASGGKVPPDVRHPSGFASWQDLSGYLRDYGISSDDDHTCGLIEQAYNHWPNDPDHPRAVASRPEPAGSRLVCDQCGAEETPPYDEGDACLCGGVFR